MRILAIVSALGVAIAASPVQAQLPAADHAAKRQRVLDAMTADGIIVVEGTATAPRSDQTYIQAQNFQALTGLVQPGSALVMWRKGGATGQRIVVPPKPAYSWDGEQIGPADASRMLGIPGIATTAFPALLDSLGARTTKVYLIPQDAGWPGLSAALVQAVGDSLVIRAAVGGARGAGGRAGGGGAASSAPVNEYAAITTALRQARAQKTDAEVALIRKASEISAEGHKAAMRMLYPGVRESEIRGTFEGTIFRLDAERIGYGSIVGTGANATFLHYRAGTVQSKPGDVVVMDAAASYQGYTSDVTRTFPVSGQFSPEQKIVYETVLAAHDAAARTLKPGSTPAQASGAATVELWKGLVKAGLVDSVGATYVSESGQPTPQLRLFYFHGLSHGLGLDVHDPVYTENGAYVVNSVFVIEPGIYVRPMTLDMVPNVPANAAYRAKLAKALTQYSGIGTRIEDAYVVTARGATCMSCGAPRTVAEVEAIAGKAPIRR
jgi:Xaa-Pro aminopeptidase